MVVTMDAHKVYDLTLVHLFKFVLNLGPRAVCYKPRATLIHRRSQGRQRGHAPPQIFRTYSQFVL